jgi:hypothetical protein
MKRGMNRQRWLHGVVLLLLWLPAWSAFSPGVLLAAGDESGESPDHRVKAAEPNVTFPGIEDRILMTAAVYVVLGGVVVLTRLIRLRIESEEVGGISATKR